MARFNRPHLGWNNDSGNVGALQRTYTVAILGGQADDTTTSLRQLAAESAACVWRRGRYFEEPPEGQYAPVSLRRTHTSIWGYALQGSERTSPRQGGVKIDDSTDPEPELRGRRPVGKAQA